MPCSIVHQSSCPYTPQQNEDVECKHRHILVAVRALRFQSSLPLQFWCECVLTSCYLINHTSSPLLRNNTPHEILLGKPPSFDHLCVFGCLCYATTLVHANKFSPRASACVFLGYSSTQKGYELMNLATKKFLISRDVVFRETIFSFASSSPSFSVFCLMHLILLSSLIILLHLCLPPLFQLIPAAFQPPRRSLRVSTPPVWTTGYSCPPPTFLHGTACGSLY